MRGCLPSFLEEEIVPIARLRAHSFLREGFRAPGQGGEGAAAASDSPPALSAPHEEGSYADPPAKGRDPRPGHPLSLAKGQRELFCFFFFFFARKIIEAKDCDCIRVIFSSCAGIL